MNNLKGYENLLAGKRGETDVVKLMMGLIIVLVVGFILIWGWNSNWKYWSSATGAYTSSDVGPWVDACGQFCRQGDAGKASFCFTPHTVNFGQEIEYNGQMVSSVTLTCSQLGDDFRKYGFTPCQDFC